MAGICGLCKLVHDLQYVFTDAITVGRTVVFVVVVLRNCCVDHDIETQVRKKAQMNSIIICFSIFVSKIM